MVTDRICSEGEKMITEEMNYACVSYVYNDTTSKKSFDYKLVKYKNKPDLIMQFARRYYIILTVFELTEDEYNELNTNENIRERYFEV